MGRQVVGGDGRFMILESIFAGRANMDEPVKISLILMKRLKEIVAHSLCNAGMAFGMLLPAESFSHEK